MTTGLPVWKLLTRTIVLGVLLLLGLEAIARLTGPVRYHAAPLELDEPLGFRGIPDFSVTLNDGGGSYEVRLNRDGFRGRALSDAPSGTGDPAERIFFYGDGQLVGLGVREADLVTSRLERSFETEADRSPGPRAASGDPPGMRSVFNLGIPDTGTGQQLLVHLTTLEQATPDVVVLALHPTDDLLDNSLELARRSPRLPGDGLRPFVEIDSAGDPQRRYANPRRAKLRTASAAFAHLERALSGFAARRGSRTLAPFPPSLGPNARMERRALPQLWLELFRTGQDSAEWDAAWERTLALVRTFRRVTEDRGARFLVVVVPSEHQVQRTARTAAIEHQVRGGLAIRLDRLVDWSAPERRLDAFFDAEGIESVSLLEPLRAAAHDGVGAFDASGRLSAEGHALWAKAVREHLADPAIPAPRPMWSGPADLIPAADAFPEPLDLAEQSAWALLGSGWKIEGFEPGEDVNVEGRRGRWMQQTAMLMVPSRRGTLVVSGYVPALRAPPNAISLNLGNVVRKRHPIEGPGPFEIRFDAPPTREVITVDRYVPLYIGAHSGSGQGTSPVLVERVALSREPADPPPASPEPTVEP